jgi:hypothetical protein
MILLKKRRKKLMKINYIVELILPAITASLGTIGKDIDVTIKRDSEGIPFFSAKHIKGILRSRVREFKLKLEELGSEELNHITTNDFIRKYFGEEGNYLEEKSYLKEKEESKESNKFTQIRFSNLKLILDGSEKIQTGNRYGIRVNRKTKTVLPQSLFNYEFLVANNKFEGNLELNDNIFNNLEELKFILACLFHLDRIGGMKSRGIGKVTVKIKIKDEELELEKNDIDSIMDKLIAESRFQDFDNKNLESNLEKFSYTLELEEAIVLKERKLGNYIKSRNSIQGSTIRGALIEYFNKKNNSLENFKKLKNIESSDATKLIKDPNSEKWIKEKIKLASLFEPKYDLKNIKKCNARVDKVIETASEIEDEKDKECDKENNEIKLERVSLSSIENIANDISIEIDEKLKSAKNGMLFNFEYISNIDKKISQKFEGDLKVPKNLLKIGDKITIYLGKYRSKGFGKATLTIKELEKSITDDNILKNDIENRIKNLTKLVRENMEEKIKCDKKIKSVEDELENIDKKVICFDLQSDVIIPFSEIYDTGIQFLILTGLNKTDLKFNKRRSFINIGKLEGYNIINNVRKIDELIFSKGSVFTYNIDDYTDELLNKLVKIEKDGIGLRKNEGFGRVKICSPREVLNDVCSRKKK